MPATGVPFSSLANGVIFNNVQVESRGQIENVVQPAANASVFAYAHVAGYVPTSASTQVQVYSDEELTIAVSQPLTTDVNGVVPGYVATGLLIDLLALVPGEPVPQVLFVNTGGGGGVSSFNGRSGAVEPETGDYSVAEVTGAAPVASPEFTGTPSAPTPAALDDSTKIATTAYADLAVAVEKGRAETMEATLAAAIAAPLTVANLAAAQPFVVDLPENHGAARDGVTDDTAAVKAAIANAVTEGIANGSYYAEVWFQALGGAYAILGAVDTTHSGRAQLPLPVMPSTGQKFILFLRGIADASVFPHWQQTTVQQAGATLRTNLNAAYSSQYGSAACIGGPTHEQLGSTDGGFSNMLVVIDGLNVVSTYSDPLHVAVDLQCVAQANVKSLGGSGNIIPGSVSALPSAGGVFLRTPQQGNNDNNQIGSASVEGYTEALIPGEHLIAERVAAVYCQIGVSMRAAPDSVRINALSVENCKYHVSTRNATPSSGWRAQVDIGTMDSEDGSGGLATTYHIDDAQNLLAGTINWQSGAPTAGAVPLVNGASNAKIISRYQGAGHVVAPSVPATTVALLNPFWRDAAVTIAGGAVTVIAVDGTPTGITTGTVIVPSGKSITVTYSSAPTWNWVLL